MTSVLVAGAAIVVLLIGGVVFFRMRPIAILNWLSRMALSARGLKRKTVESSLGPQTFWEGGSGRALVLLHGVGDHAGTWAKVAPSLARGYHVLVPDLAGRGASAPATGPLSFDMVIAGLDAILSSRLSDPCAQLR